MAREAIFTVYDLPVAKRSRFWDAKIWFDDFALTKPEVNRLIVITTYRKNPMLLSGLSLRKIRQKQSSRPPLDRNNPSELWRATVHLLVSILGAKTGNWVLKVFATDGVYIAGGAALHLIDILREPRFMHAFLNKGRFNNLMSRIPVPVITAPAALVGAAIYGLETLERHKGTA